MTVLSAQDIEEIAIQTCEPIAWRNAASAYLKEGNIEKYHECLRQRDYAIINIMGTKEEEDGLD
jgi:hypothetical protein